MDAYLARLREHFELLPTDGDLTDRHIARLRLGLEAIDDVRRACSAQGERLGVVVQLKRT